jgi:hypothetical protein
MPLDVLHQTLGHANIATTTYLTAERDRMVPGVAQGSRSTEKGSRRSFPQP